MVVRVDELATLLRGCKIPKDIESVELMFGRTSEVSPLDGDYQGVGTIREGQGVFIFQGKLVKD